MRPLSFDPQALRKLAGLYSDLGLLDQSVAIHRQQVQLAKSVYGPSSPETARGLAMLAVDIGGSSSVRDQGAVIREAERILDRKRDFGSRTRALLYSAMADYYAPSDIAKGLEANRKAVEIYKRYPPSIELVQALESEGVILRDLDRYRESAAQFSEAEKLARSLGNEANRLIPTLFMYLGDTEFLDMNLDAADRNYRSALGSARTLRGEEHADVIVTTNHLANFLLETARPQEAITLLNRALELAVRIKGPQDWLYSGDVETCFGRVLTRYGRTEEGSAHTSRAIELRGIQPQEPRFAQVLNNKAVAEIEFGHYAQAQELLDRAAGIFAKAGDQPTSRSYRVNLLWQARLLLAAGRAEEAAGILEPLRLAEPPRGDVSQAWLDVSLVEAQIDLSRGHYQAAMERAR